MNCVPGFAGQSVSFCLILVIAALLWPTSVARAEDAVAIPDGLSQYVKRPESVYRWELRSKTNRDAGVVYELHLISQNWQGMVWEHAVQVFQPANAKPAKTMLVWNQGGRPSEGSSAFGWDLAQKIGSPVAFLYGVPNQPLLGNKVEDALIAETFVRYLETKDANWPLLFPMVKSVVKTMDALQAFSEQEWKVPVQSFVITGASKRGWTTWLTGATDPRVKAIAPLVIDTLNMKAQTPYQLKSFGKYSDQIHDYTERGLVPMPDTADAKRLWAMVDPWVYRERLKMPKLLLNGANDPYWTTDAMNLYWDDLSGPKWVTYVPNAGHNLEQRGEDGSKDRRRAVHSLAAFARHVIDDTPMPKLIWKHDDASNVARLTIDAEPAPKAARLWVASAPTRDFRQSRWKDLTLTAGGKIVGEVPVPTSGSVVFFAELDYDAGGLSHQLSTQMRILDAGK